MLLVLSFIINTIILGSASLVLFKIDVYTFHKDVPGLFQSLGIGVYLFFIPIITWISVLAAGLRIIRVYRT